MAAPVWSNLVDMAGNWDHAPFPTRGTRTYLPCYFWAGRLMLHTGACSVPAGRLTDNDRYAFSKPYLEIPRRACGGQGTGSHRVRACWLIQFDALLCVTRPYALFESSQRLGKRGRAVVLDCEAAVVHSPQGSAVVA